MHSSDLELINKLPELVTITAYGLSKAFIIGEEKTAVMIAATDEYPIEWGLIQHKYSEATANLGKFLITRFIEQYRLDGDGNPMGCKDLTDYDFSPPDIQALLKDFTETIIPYLPAGNFKAEVKLREFVTAIRGIQLEPKPLTYFVERKELTVPYIKGGTLVNSVPINMLTAINPGDLNNL